MGLQKRRTRVGLVVRSIRCFVLTILFAGFALAAPMLRLATATVGPVSVATGANDTEIVEAYNAGDGSLSLKADVTGASWLSAAVGAARTCQSVQASACIPLTFTLNTASLAAGTYTGVVTVSDPNAADAPQTITVTVQVGGGVPARIETYAAPGVPRDITFYTNTDLTMKVAVDGGGTWLQVPGSSAGTFSFRYTPHAHPQSAGLAVNGSGTFTYVIPNTVKLRPGSSMSPGDYSGTVTTTSSFAPDAKTIQVLMHLVNKPIAQAGVDSVQIRLAQGAPAYTASVPVSNVGAGTLQLTSIKADNAAWIVSAATSSAGASFTVDAGSLSPGTYNATLNIATNAANGTLDVPVQFQVVPKGAPLIYYQGVVDNGTYTPNSTVVPGEIMIVKGEQLASTAFQWGPGIPLSSNIAGARVLVNGLAAPMFYAMYGQLAFQLPMETALGTAMVQVERDGQLSNKASIHVGTRDPRILVCPVDTRYGIITYPDWVTWAIPPGLFPGVASRAAHPGETLTIWAIGLGATNPSVASGAPAPVTEPLARMAQMPQVSFGGIGATPSFAGLAPGYAGLYQINVTVPVSVNPGTLELKLIFPDAISNSVLLPIQ